MSIGAWKVDLAAGGGGEDVGAVADARLRDQLDGATLHAGGGVQTVDGAVVEDVKGEEQREQHDREEGGCQLGPRHADHEDAVGGLAVGRPHHRAARHPPFRRNIMN